MIEGRHTHTYLWSSYVPFFIVCVTISSCVQVKCTSTSDTQCVSDVAHCAPVRPNVGIPLPRVDACIRLNLLSSKFQFVSSVQCEVKLSGGPYSATLHMRRSNPALNCWAVILPADIKEANQDNLFRLIILHQMRFSITFTLEDFNTLMKNCCRANQRSRLIMWWTSHPLAQFVKRNHYPEGWESLSIDCSKSQVYHCRGPAAAWQPPAGWLRTRSDIWGRRGRGESSPSPPKLPCTAESFQLANF